MIISVSLNPAVDKIIYIDNFEAGKMFKTNNIKISAGGKGVNVAKVISCLKNSVLLHGFVAGNTGRLIEKMAQDLNISTNLTLVDGETRTNINIIDTKKGRETEILEPSPAIKASNISDFLLALEKDIKLLEGKKGYVVLSGSLPNGVPDTFYKEVINEYKEKVNFIVDTSQVALEKAIEAEPFLIKPNKRELSAIVGRELLSLEEIIAAANEILDKGVKNIVVSLGDEGAILLTKNQCYYGKINRPIKIVNTIGSGDSMVAGIVTALDRGNTLIEAFKLGLACGACNAEFEEIGHVDEKIVNTMLEQIIIHKL